ncbi:hypothetical protein ACH4C2_12485 [Streptomyces sp. NPDC018057]|uniref:hypothetical protein n=1 Tax=unclassified Streptomyces TaxID=2593676 RepID=UPI00378CB02A
MNELTRRRFVGATAGAATGLAATTLTVLGPAAAAVAAGPHATAWSGARSANGRPVLDRAGEPGIEGSGRTVRLAAGDVPWRSDPRRTRPASGAACTRRS